MAEKKRDKDGRILPPNVTQRPDGVYMWRKMVDGQAYQATSKNLGELKRKIVDMEYDIKHGIVKEKNPLANITMDEWFDKWIKTYKEGVVKETTILKYTSDYRVHISPVFGKMKVKDIKNVHAVEFAQSLQGKGLCNTTVDSNMFILRDMLVRAEENDIIKKVPFKKITLRRDTYDGKTKRPRRALSREEQKAFLEFVYANDDFKVYANYFTVLFGTGMRVGEINALRACDIDFEKNVINVNHQFIYDNFGEGCVTKVTIPKTRHSIRNIPMTATVKEALKRQIEQTEEATKGIEVDGYTGFIFLNSENRIMQKKHAGQLIDRIVLTYNNQQQEKVINGEQPFFLKRFTTHESRHTFATRCIEVGMTPKTLQEILGHSAFHTTMDLYTHVLGDTKEREIKLLENIGL